MDIFFSTYLKMFFIMTPFFVLTVFMTLTNHATVQEKKALAIKVTVAVIVASLMILFFGQYIFSIFGVTLDAFKIGAGMLLFLTAVDLVRGSRDDKAIKSDNISELAVVPLAIPIIIGPGTIGILFVLGASFESTGSLAIASLALICAVITIGFMLYTSQIIHRIIGRDGLLVLSKITGLFLAALSAQIVFSGIKAFLGL